MKHRRPFVMPKQMLPRKEKEMLSIINDPEAFKRVMELQKTALAVREKTENSNAFGWTDWSARIINILPKQFKDNEEIIKRINDFVTELKGNYDDTPNELKTSDI